MVSPRIATPGTVRVGFSSTRSVTGPLTFNDPGQELRSPQKLFAFRGLFGGRARTRTVDPLIKSQLLYQLSYAPAWGAAAKPQEAGF